MSQPHLDDEQLSSHVDGLSDQETTDHLPGCRACQSRLADLRAVAAWVGQTPEAPTTTDQAVAAALGAARPSTRRRTPPWQRPPVVALAVAAAIVVVLAAIPLLTRTRPTTSTADRATAAADSAAPTVSGGDLGDQSDETALRDAVRNAMSPRPEAAAAPQASSGVPAAATSCLDEARQVVGVRPVLQYTATLRWRSRTAAALVFSAAASAGGTLSHQLLVLGRPGCEVLVSQRF